MKKPTYSIPQDKQWMVTCFFLFLIIIYCYPLVFAAKNKGFDFSNKENKESVSDPADIVFLNQSWRIIPKQLAISTIPLTTDLSLSGCRKILEQNGEKYSDEQILKIKKMLYNVGHLDYELYVKMKNRKS